MKAWIGKSMIALGVAHTVFGLVVFGDLLAPAIREGVFNTISAASPPERAMAFWFLGFGFIAPLLGGLIDWVERMGLETPGFLAWGLLALAVVGCAMMPASGFWLLFAPAVGLLLRRRSLRAEVSTGP